MNGDEVECAQVLDSLPAVRHWVRNGDQGKHSFSLPLSTGWFHPDLVAELNDGSVFVVEHKGAHLLADAAEKDLVGRHWARQSGWRCRFVMATSTKGGPTLRRQIEDALIID